MKLKKPLVYCTRGFLYSGENVFTYQLMLKLLHLLQGVTSKINRV
jgi:hypothetical protein